MGLAREAREKNQMRLFFFCFFLIEPICLIDCSLREYCPELWKNNPAKRCPRKENAELSRAELQISKKWVVSRGPSKVSRERCDEMVLPDLASL
jgi:hypothetical protein